MDGEPIYISVDGYFDSRGTVGRWWILPFHPFHTLRYPESWTEAPEKNGKQEMLWFCLKITPVIPVVYHDFPQHLYLGPGFLSGGVYPDLENLRAM